ncbi:MAG: hypothetical protein ISR65_17595 [Bacteriovoracaceae bacterium]|nr:hypothetical protein [Bacteriovoracaceae bacterium]
MKYLFLLFLSFVLYGNDNQNTTFKEIGLYRPYNKKVITSIRNLQMSDLSIHPKVLNMYSDLKSRRAIETTSINNDDFNNQFIANNPKIFFNNTDYRVPCSTVKHAHRAAQYFFKRFKRLRSEALDLLTKMDTASVDDFDSIADFYQEVLDEIVEILDLVENAYPTAFDIIDRHAVYTFKESEEYTNKINPPDSIPHGIVKVSKIKFGSNQWIPIYTGIKGISNLIGEPIVDQGYRVKVKRYLTPLEACLGDLRISIIGTVKFGRKAKRRYKDSLPYRPTPWPTMPPWVDPIPPWRYRSSGGSFNVR